MTTAYLAISLLKQSIIPYKQLKIFLSYLPSEALLQYLSLASIYDSTKPTSKKILIDLIVDNEDVIENLYTEENNQLTIDAINHLISKNRDHVISIT